MIVFSIINRIFNIKTILMLIYCPYDSLLYKSYQFNLFTLNLCFIKQINSWERVQGSGEIKSGQILVQCIYTNDP